MNFTSTQLWGEIRSILHSSSTDDAETVSDTLAKWPCELAQERELLHYISEFRPEWIPSSYSPPPHLLELWLRGKALKLFELLCNSPPPSHKNYNSNTELEALVSFFHELSYEENLEISLTPMTKLQAQTVWRWVSSQGQLLPRSPKAWHPTKGEIELVQLNNFIEEVFTNHEQGSFHPLVNFHSFKADTRFARLPEMSLWFLNGYMELTFWGGSGFSAQQLISFFEMLWIFIQSDVPVPSFDEGSPYFEPCWQRFIVLRNSWDSVTKSPHASTSNITTR